MTNMVTYITLECSNCHYLPDSQQLDGTLWCGDAELDLALAHAKLSIELALVVQGGVPLSGSHDKLRHMDSHPGHKLHSG